MQLELPTVWLVDKYDYWPYITVVTDGGQPTRAYAETGGLPSRDNRFRWYTPWAYSEQASYADEGVLWIRGYHEPDSPALLALLAAAALHRNSQPGGTP